GDVVRANYLLKKSREIFARLTPQNAVARQELAETDHMLARLILHVDARPGREEDAVRIGIEHALAAEEAYRDLSLPREQARVWETLGRLELLRGRGDAAIERLEASVRAQQRFGDVLGLARSAAALSDLLAAAGRSRDALALLGQSIAFNLDKGSPLGLAFNRAALEALATKSPDDEPEQRAFLESLRKQVRAGEALLGRADLPEDARTNQDIRGNSG
ncbi:MAG TPA: tetratricopeptide repeat protein, partial [Polyangiaceae bacterium]|nr:tetratricopeptide repeat protein [Polyangiaceae bacterium]